MLHGLSVLAINDIHINFRFDFRPYSDQSEDEDYAPFEHRKVSKANS